MQRVGLVLIALVVAHVFWLPSAVSAGWSPSALQSGGALAAPRSTGGLVGDLGLGVTPGSPGEVMPASKPTFGYGVTAQLLGQPMVPLLNGITGMYFEWVRQPLRWRDIELTPGQYEWSQLDLLVEQVAARGLHLMLVVSGTPDWARPTGVDLTYDGPPADLGQLGAFLSALAGRYAGRVAAYQIWQDPNLANAWDSPTGLSAADYVALLRLAYQTIQAASPESLVLSAGLFPTNRMEEAEVVSDLVYLSEMYQAGLADSCDGIGVHVDGQDHVPAAYLLDTASSWEALLAQSWAYFRHYEAIRWLMAYYGDDDKSIWLTQVGWSACDAAPDNAGCEATLAEQQQASRLIEAYRIAERVPYVAAMIVDNFNLSAADPGSPLAAYSLIRADWSARPAFQRLAQMRQEQLLLQAGASPLRGRNRAPQAGVKPYLRSPAVEAG